LVATASIWFRGVFGYPDRKIERHRRLEKMAS